MKLSYSLLLAAASCGMAFGAATAYTTPVGYLSIDVAPQSDQLISVPLQTAVAWAGASTTVSGDTVSVSSTPTAPFTADQYAGAYMLQVTSGALTGRTFPILSIGTADVTVDPVGSTTLAAQGFANADTFVIRPYWTLNTLFPDGAGIGLSSDPFSPSSELLLFDNAMTGINRSAAALYFYYDGSIGGDAGWYKSGETELGLQNDVILPPSTTLAVRNGTEATTLNVVLSGEVASTPAATLVIADTVDNDTFAQLSYPIDTTLNQSGLFESGAVAASPDPFSPGDQVLVFDPTATEVNPAASALYFYYDGSIGGDPGWYQSGLAEEGVKGDLPVLLAGSHIIIRKTPATGLEATTWTAPLPYTP